MSERLVLIASNFAGFSGPTVHLLDLANALADLQDRDLILVTHKTRVDRDFQAAIRFPVSAILRGSSTHALMRLAAVTENARRLRSGLRGSDVPFVNSSSDVAVSARLAWKRDLLVGYNVLLDLPPRWSGLEAGLNRMPWSARLRRWADPWVARQCVRRILAHTRFQAGLYAQIGVPFGRITIMPHAVDLERIRGMAALGEDPWPAEHDALRVLLMRRLVPSKGIREALRACERVSADQRLDLLVIGRGPLEEEVRVTAKKSEAPLRVLHHPFLPMPSALRAIAAADVVLVPSWFEMFGMIVLEAMALGRCVIASSRGGVSEVVRDGVTGLLAPARDVAALTQTLLRSATDVALRRRIGDAGRREAETQFNARSIAPRFLRWVDAVA